MTNPTAQLLEQHFDTAFSAPNGIKKLRELILNLAMQGKLVAQDPNDQPASELLKEITVEKERLVKEGKIKKQKPLPAIGEDEKPYLLPQGWEWVRLGEISYIFSGNSFQSTDFITEGGVKVIKITNAGVGCLIDTNEFLPIEFLNKYKDFVVYKNDLVLALTRPYISAGLKVSVCTEDFDHSLLNQRVAAIRLFFQHDFIYRYLSSPYVLSLYQERFNANGLQPNLKMSDVSDLMIPLPPLAEQQRIVAKIDELMVKCDALEALQQAQASQRTQTHQAAIQQLLTTDDTPTAWRFLKTHFETLYQDKANVKELRKAILQLAVMGKLLPQDPKDQPASELLKQITAEKERLVKEGKIKKQKPLPAIDEDEKPYELPHGWEWVRLGDAISQMDSGWSPKCETVSAKDDEWGVLKTTSVQPMCFYSNENKSLPTKFQPRIEIQVNEGDILITRAGPRNRVGITCVAKSVRHNLMLSDKIIRFKIIGNRIYADYCALFLNVGFGSEQIEKMKSGMADSQVNISQDKIKQIVLYIPPLTEQQRIVAKIDQLMSLCDQLEARIDECTGKQSELLAAVMSEV
jgi:type I restriction enzyme S subunit